MADRFPLIVNAVSKKIEEIVAGDYLELSGNGIVISGDYGAGKYLTSDGSTVFWDSPGDVYLTLSQTLSNKTLESSIISGSNNTITNIPNSALVNSGLVINGSTVSLGGSITTPDTNTTYQISVADTVVPTEKSLTITGNDNSTDSVTLVAGTNMLLAGQGDELTTLHSWGSPSVKLAASAAPVSVCSLMRPRLCNPQ